MLSYNYTREQIRERQEWLLQIPLRLDIYEIFIPLFKKALGEMFQTEYYVCSQNNYSQSYVFFQRFCFDFVSLSGSILYQISLNQYEYIFRKVFSALTFYDKYIEELSFKAEDNITSPITKEFMIDIFSNKRKKTIIQGVNINSKSQRRGNHSYRVASSLSPRGDYSSIGGGGSNVGGYNLSSLSARQTIDNKKRASIKKRESGLSQNSNTKTAQLNQSHQNIQRQKTLKQSDSPDSKSRSPAPKFKIPLQQQSLDDTHTSDDASAFRDKTQEDKDRSDNNLTAGDPRTAREHDEDQNEEPEEMVELINLNQIAQKVKEDQAKRKLEIQNRKMIKIMPFIINCNKENLDTVMNQPEILKQINKDLQLGKYMMHSQQKDIDPVNQRKANESIKNQGISHVNKNRDHNYANDQQRKEEQELRVKQLLMFKQLSQINKEEEETEQEQTNSEEEDDADTVLSPALRSPTNKKGGSPRKWKHRPSLQFPEFGIPGIQATVKDQASGVGVSHENEEDAKYIKYVWNKKTKRLEKRDLRKTNLENIDKYKFEKFQKVNQKSKVLCMPNENYLNTSFFGDFSPEQARKELLYGIQEEADDTDYLNQRMGIKRGNTFLSGVKFRSGVASVQSSNRKYGFGNASNLSAHRSNLAGPITSNNNQRLSSIEANQKRARSQITSENHINRGQTDQAQIEQKLKMIKMILRGEDYDDQIYLHQTSLLFSADNYSAQRQYQMEFQNSNRFSNTLGFKQRSTEVKDNRKMFMRNRIQRVQLQNKMAIQNQRELTKMANQSLQMHHSQLPKLELSSHRNQNLLDLTFANFTPASMNKYQASLRLRLSTLKNPGLAVGGANSNQLKLKKLNLNPTFDVRQLNGSLYQGNGQDTSKRSAAAETESRLAGFGGGDSIVDIVHLKESLHLPLPQQVLNMTLSVDSRGNPKETHSLALSPQNFNLSLEEARQISREKDRERISSGKNAKSIIRLNMLKDNPQSVQSPIDQGIRIINSKESSAQRLNYNLRDSNENSNNPLQQSLDPQNSNNKIENLISQSVTKSQQRPGFLSHKSSNRQPYPIHHVNHFNDSNIQNYKKQYSNKYQTISNQIEQDRFRFQNESSSAQNYNQFKNYNQNVQDSYQQYQHTEYFELTSQNDKSQMDQENPFKVSINNSPKKRTSLTFKPSYYHNQQKQNNLQYHSINHKPHHNDSTSTVSKYTRNPQYQNERTAVGITQQYLANHPDSTTQEQDSTVVSQPNMMPINIGGMGTISGTGSGVPLTSGRDPFSIKRSSFEAQPNQQLKIQNAHDDQLNEYLVNHQITDGFENSHTTGKFNELIYENYKHQLQGPENGPRVTETGMSVFGHQTQYNKRLGITERFQKNQEENFTRKMLNSTLQNPLQKNKATIHQVPMQDFQLERWRSAYRNTQSATRHFYTGTSFIVLDKI